jgi:pimeloyl-ACP methyl ester carboxylesterase
MSPEKFTRRALHASILLASIALPLTSVLPYAAVAKEPPSAATAIATFQVHYKTATIDGVDIAYREAGRADAPAIILLHGFPTSSHQYRNLIPALADKYRVIAPDYPGFGQSAAPERPGYKYTFDTFAKLVEGLTENLGVSRYALYVMDYGAPVGFRIAAKHPDRVTALIVQNGNAYNEGLQKFWEPIQKYWASGNNEDREAIRWLTSLKATKWQYTHGVPDLTLVSPDTWTHDQALLDRAGNQEIQLDLFYDYRTNVPLYPEWQAYFRKHQPAMLVLWGKNDQIFVADGAAPYKRDLKDVELHLLDAGHFALETNGPEMAELIRDFLSRKVPTQKAEK